MVKRGNEISVLLTTQPLSLQCFIWTANLPKGRVGDEALILDLEQDFGSIALVPGHCFKLFITNLCTVN